MDDSIEHIAEAVRTAEKADVVVMVLGDQFPYFGEFKSTAKLELMGGQKRLLEEVANTGKPVILVLINSKPLILTSVIDKCAAVIEAWNPAMLGGTAVAEVLFGEVNPSGKLTISFPRHAGQIPVYYNRIPGQHNKNYADLLQEPLFPFGFGLSYTTFSYGKLLLGKKKIKEGNAVTASIEVKNTGNKKGIEIVQLYLNDKVTSATWPRKILKAYARVELKPGQKKKVRFDLIYEQLAFVNADANWVVEPGDFELLAGPSSKDSDLKKAAFALLG
jgi:beta-glucosidase